MRRQGRVSAHGSGASLALRQGRAGGTGGILVWLGAPAPGSRAFFIEVQDMRLARAGTVVVLAVLAAACDKARTGESVTQDATASCTRCHGYPPPPNGPLNWRREPIL